MLNCLKVTTEDDHSSVGLIFQLLCEVYHFTQQLCLFVIQPGLVNCSTVLILRIFIQPTICSQLCLPGLPWCGYQTTDQPSWHLWLKASFTYCADHPLYAEPKRNNKHTLRTTKDPQMSRTAAKNWSENTTKNRTVKVARLNPQRVIFTHNPKVFATHIDVLSHALLFISTCPIYPSDAGQVSFTLELFGLASAQRL